MNTKISNLWLLKALENHSPKKSKIRSSITANTTKTPVFDKIKWERLSYAKQWKEMEKEALEEVKICEVALLRLYNSRVETAGWLNDSTPSSEINKFLTSPFKNIIKENENFSDSLSKILIGSKGVSKKRTEEMIEWITTYDSKSILKKVHEDINHEIAKQNRYFDFYNKRLLIGYYSLFISSLNKERGNINKNNDLDWLNNQNEYSKTLQKNLWSALKGGRINQANDICLDMISNMQKPINRLSQIIANSESDKLIYASEIVRNTLYNLVMGNYIRWFLIDDKSTSRKNLLDKSKLLKFNNSNNPKTTSIESLVKSPSKYINKKITIQGSIEKVVTTHRGKKSITSATLFDSLGNSVNIVLPYIKFDASGIVDGTQIIITGEYKSKIEYFGNNNGFQIERKNLTLLKNNSWTDFMAYCLRNTYTINPHNINGKWSMEKGIDGAVNPIKYGIIFL